MLDARRGGGGGRALRGWGLGVRANLFTVDGGWALSATPLTIEQRGQKVSPFVCTSLALRGDRSRFCARFFLLSGNFSSSSDNTLHKVGGAAGAHSERQLGVPPGKEKGTRPPPFYRMAGVRIWGDGEMGVNFQRFWGHWNFGHFRGGMKREKNARPGFGFPFFFEQGGSPPPPPPLRARPGPCVSSHNLYK